jgi:hypothetical protein
MKNISVIFAVATLVAALGCNAPLPEVSYTTISATVNDPIKLDEVPHYPKQIYCYPTVSGMSSAAVQDSLNRLFKIADLSLLRADSQYVNVQEIDSYGYPESDRFFSYEWLKVSYISNELVSYSGMEEFDGGAHPSYTLRKGHTIALSNFRPIPLDNLFKGDYRQFFKQKIAALLQTFDLEFEGNGTVEPDEFGSTCGDVLDVLLLRMDTVSTTANMLLSDSTLSILQVDFRDFGCPEAMRGVIEVCIPYSELVPYINRAGYLRRFIK